MRSKFYFGAFAALALGMASCASDEPTVDNSGGNTVGDKYMAVTIKTVGEGETRALPGDADFEAGVGNENALSAEQIRFYFFTETGAPFVMSRVNVGGTVTNTNMLQPITLNVADNTNGEDANLTGVLVLGTPEGYVGNTPAKVVAVANPKNNFSFEELANIPLSKMEEKTATVQGANFNPDAFTMTSSSYVDDGNVINFTDVKGKIKDTAAAAEADPAVIYLERLAAKIRVQGLGTYTVQERKNGALVDATFPIWTSDATPTPTTLRVKLEGWQIINRAHTSYILKSITNDMLTTAPFTDWNDVNRHRSYWEYATANADTDFSDRSYKIYGDEAANYFKLGNFDRNDDTANVAYTFGNTQFSENTATNREDNATGIMVKATVLKPGSDTEGYDIVKWGAEYFEYDYFLQVVINAYNNETGQKLSVEDVELKYSTKSPNKYVAVVNGTEYERFKDISWWRDGVTTYRANVLHHSEGTTNLFAIVRNHIYDYTFTNVFGLGVPGEDPNNPEKETETYLAAAVRVLNWHIVTRSVVLGE